MRIDELSVLAGKSLIKLTTRDKDHSIASCLAGWSWELSLEFKAPILVMLVPGHPDSALVAVPLPNTVAISAAQRLGDAE